MKIKNKKIIRKVINKFFFILSLLVLSLYVLLPMLNMLFASVKPLESIQIIGSSFIPTKFDFGTYKRMWKTVPLLHYIKNSLIIVGFATFISVLLSITVGYVMDRFKFRGNKIFGDALILAQMLPGILFLLPLYLLFNLIYKNTGIKLVGTYPGLIITYLTFSLPFSIWMMKSYFNSIPYELEEAAYLDGCSYLRTLFQIILPIAKPGVVAVSIYSFLMGWEEILFASILTNDATRTISVGLRTYSAGEVIYWNEMMAAAITITIPVVIAFLFFQKYLVQGLASGGVKG